MIRRVNWIDHLPLIRPTTGLLMNSSSVLRVACTRKCSRSLRFTRPTAFVRLLATTYPSLPMIPI